MSTVATGHVSGLLGSLRDLIRRIFTFGNQDASPRMFDRAQHMVIQHANFMINQNGDIVLGPPHTGAIHPAAAGQSGGEHTAPTSPAHVYDPPRSLNKGSDVYVDCLLPKGYGHPLWVPSPNMSLPISYRLLGVSVGDVGVLTPQGGFDFLFNIFHDATHPINAAVGVPDTFVPFTPGLAAVDVQHFVELNAGSCLADPSTVTVNNGGDRSTTTFEATGPEGAVLVIPEDMHSTTLKITTRLRKYVAENIVAWYKYLKHSLGHDIDNGDLLVIYGCQKSTGFGIATAFNTGRRENTRLSFFVEGSQADTSRCPYRWTHTGSAEAKAGSSAQSNVEFSSTEPARNQCLFIKTIKTRLSAEAWTSADLDSVIYAVPSPNIRESEYTKHGSTGQSSASGSESTSFSSLAPGHEPAFHLSTVLHYILEAITPGPSTYIVCDDDWAPFISDSTLDARDFIDRILENRIIIEDQGMLFFGAGNDTDLLEELNQGHGAQIKFNRIDNSSNTKCSQWRAERRGISSSLTQRAQSDIKEGVHSGSDRPSVIYQDILKVSQQVQAANVQSGVVEQNRPHFFNRYQNLQIRGDVIVFSGSEPTDGGIGLFGSQEIQVLNSQSPSRVVEQGWKLLCDNTAPSALYGYRHSFTGPRCHPGTRIAIQDCIFKWLNDVDGQVAMWMNGPVGVGKSAIAYTVADLAAEREQLSSAFFFFRSDHTRNSTEHLIPTMAYEMVQQIPHTRGSLCKSIVADPLMFSSPLDRQINAALLQPLRTEPASQSSSSESTRLVIIDGLDECLDTDAQEAIIRSFISNLLSMSAEIIPHRLLIVSRPEPHIASTFSALNIRSHVKHLSLESWDTEDDIGTFLCAKLDEIKETHPLRHHLPEIWPDDDLFRSLRRKSVGSFAYASAAMRYLASHKSNPKHVLDDLLSFQPRRAIAAFADLDALYRHALLSLDPESRIILQKVLCLYLYSSENDIASLAACLSEEQTLVEIALIRLSSLVQIRDKAIRFHHISFEEFLRDKERSGEFYVFSPNTARAVATALSTLWLQPGFHPNEEIWFDSMRKNIDLPIHERDMNVAILTTLVTTKLVPRFTLGGRLFAVESVTGFLHAIQSKSESNFTSIDGPLFKQASDVVCTWLRMQLNAFFQCTATLDDFLDFILFHNDKEIQDRITQLKNPDFEVLHGLALLHGLRFGFLCQIFPELDPPDICFHILEGFLALPRAERDSDSGEPMSHGDAITWANLYLLVLGRPEAKVPRFCHRLEQLILDGKREFPDRKWLSTNRPSSTSKDHIRNSLYGLFWRDDDVMCRQVVEKTDSYIRQVHAGVDFEYISSDVAAVFKALPDPS